MNQRSLNMLPQVGVYTLLIHLQSTIRLKVGALGEHQLQRGYYAYTGSALGFGTSRLKKRVERHLQKKKRKFWHIDYLLARKDAVVIAVTAAQTNRKIECKINRCLKEITTNIPVLGFGASDCKEDCGSHLLYLGKENVRWKIASFYSENLGVEPVVVNLTKISNPSSLNFNLSRRATFADHDPTRKLRRCRSPPQN